MANVAGGHERAVSKKEALSIIAKLRAGKSSVMTEARRIGCYHATVRKALRAALGSKEYAKLGVEIRRMRKLAASATRPRRERKLSARDNTSRKESEPPPPAPITPRGPARYGDGPVEVVAGKTVELKLSETRVLLLQRLDNSLRITSARRTARTLSDALMLGGTIIVPHNKVADVCDALREAAG